MTPGTCIHFLGTQNKLCAAKIDIRKLVGGPDLGWACRMPCIERQFNSSRPVEKVACQYYQEPTAQQLKEDEEMWQRISLGATTASRAIREHAAGKTGVAGEFPCPVCKTGTLRYQISGYNGHARAQCTTEDCVNFIE